MQPHLIDFIIKDMGFKGNTNKGKHQALAPSTSYFRGTNRETLMMKCGSIDQSSEN
jgi:hypothetical protein